MLIDLPTPCLLALIGPSGAGKSTFARRHFLPTEIVSSDTCRALISDDEADQSASGDAFEVLHLIAGKRLAHRKLVVVDATNVQRQSRRNLTAIASRQGTKAVGLVFLLPPEVYAAHNQQRPGRIVPEAVIARQLKELQDSLPTLAEEGFWQCHVIATLEDLATIQFRRLPPAHLRLDETGPFDLIGDVHGCFDELCLLLSKLGYTIQEDAGKWRAAHPLGRKLLFVGDLVDRGPKIVETLRFVMDLVEAGQALCVIGNHDDKLLRHLRGNRVAIAHGLAESLEQLEPQPTEFKERVQTFLAGLEYHLVLDGGKLVLAHAGLKESMHGKLAKSCRSFALYGDVSGEVDADGLPVRGDWGADYRGQALVVHGHTPLPEARWINETVNLDTGCVFGNRLTALRYPEREIVSVPAARVYHAPRRPLGDNVPSS